MSFLRDYGVVKMEESSEGTLRDISKSSEEEFIAPVDPGPCPTFMFMPSKVQVMKMIIKAAHYTES